MKKSIKNLLLILAILVGSSVFAQGHMTKDAKLIKLSQTPGKFNKEELKLKAGKAYVFEIANNGVGHNVGFVIAPKGKTEQEHHIQNAYVQEMVANGKSASSKEVVLEKGEYVYFCPLNPTPQYNITVR